MSLGLLPKPIKLYSSQNMFLACVLNWLQSYLSVGISLVALGAAAWMLACTWITWAWRLPEAVPVLTQMAGETGPHSSVIQPTACFQTQHVFHICSEDSSGILNSSKLYSGTECSDFPGFSVNGCSAAYKVIAKGSKAAFCVKPLWSIPYINIPWCKPHNCFPFQCVLNTLIICVYSFLPGWLLSSFFLSVFWFVWANLTTSLKLILGGLKSVNH